MDEAEKIAMINLYKEIKFNIENVNPPDRSSIAQLDEIKNKSKVFFFFFILPIFSFKSYDQFLSNIVDHLDPTYHANINLKPLDTPRPKIVPPQAPQPNYQMKKPMMTKDLGPSSFAPFIKQPEIKIGSNNSSFNKPISQLGSQSLMPTVMKNPNLIKSNTEMPPPQNAQKLHKDVKNDFVKKIYLKKNLEQNFGEMWNQ